MNTREDRPEAAKKNTQQRSLVLYVAASLDGYIATQEHSVEWLMQIEGEGDNGFSQFYSTVDTIVMGRLTYDWLVEHAQEFPYKDRKCYVLSNRRTGENEHVTFVNREAAALTAELKQQGGKDIWLMGGGVVASSFIRSHLVDQIIVAVAPVILGKGIPLFKCFDFQTNLRLNSVKRYRQMVTLDYDVVR